MTRPTREPLSADDDLCAPCPKCGAWVEDLDGFGVLAHYAPMPDACGYCSHPSRDGDGHGGMKCGICGDVMPAPRKERKR